MSLTRMLRGGVLGLSLPLAMAGVVMADPGLWVDGAASAQDRGQVALARRWNVKTVKDLQGWKLAPGMEWAREPMLILVSTDGKSRFGLYRGDIFKFRMHLYQVINFDGSRSARILDTANQREFVLTPGKQQPSSVK